MSTSSEKLEVLLRPKMTLHDICILLEVGHAKARQYADEFRKWYEEEYPDILFAKDGEIYNFDGYECIVIGGAYSVDKDTKALHGLWFANEQPSKEIKDYVESQLAKRDYQIDVVLSHTCPLDYQPIEVFLSGIDQKSVDSSTEEWLNEIEHKLEYKKWYCGHYHTYKKLYNVEMMFKEIEKFTVE